MLSPKRVKYRKPHLTALRGYSKGATKVDFGEYGLQACENGWITARQIEAVRVAISRKMKKGGKIWIRIFNVEYWTAAVKRGRVMFEIAGVPRELAEQAFRTASFKLPIKVKMLTREGAGE